MVGEGSKGADEPPKDIPLDEQAQIEPPKTLSSGNEDFETDATVNGPPHLTSTNDRRRQSQYQHHLQNRRTQAISTIRPRGRTRKVETRPRFLSRSR